MRSCVRAVLLITFLAARAMSAQPAERQFTSPACQFAFRHPADWEVVADTIERACGFTLRPHDWRQRLLAHDDVDLFSVHLRVFPRGVWRQAAKSGFERQAGRWVVRGRHGMPAAADSVNGLGWTGLRGTMLAGCYREGGGYFGTCENPAAVLGTATRSVFLVGGPRSEVVFDRVVATLGSDR